MFERIWAYIRLKKILKALGIKKLTPQQTGVILNKNIDYLWLWERQSGKTTTAIIYTLLWNKNDLFVSPDIVCIPDPDLCRVPASRRFVYKKLMEAHRKCEDAGIRVFKPVKKRDIERRWRNEYGTEK